DLDLLGLAETVEVHAPLLVERSPLLEETGTATLANPVDQGAVAPGSVLVPHRYAVDQRVGKPLDPSQCSGLTERGFLLSLLVVGGGTPGAFGRLEEVFGEPVSHQPPRLIGDRKVLLKEVAVVNALVLRVLAQVGGHELFDVDGGGILFLLLGLVHLVGGLLEIPTAG